jgi:dihydrofolate reductase
MKTILFMAMSLNGFVADKDGLEDFLSHDGWDVFVELAERVGVFIIGRKTYDIVKATYEGFGFDDLKADKIIVSAQAGDPPIGWRIATSPQEALEIAEKLGHSEAVLTGVSTLNAAFLSRSLVDEVIFNIEPVIVGGGIPVVATFDGICKLSFQETMQRPGGVVQQRYKIETR